MCLGVIALLLTRVLSRMVCDTGEDFGMLGWCGCLSALPVAGALIGWLVPRGAPGASIVVAVYLAETLPVGIGPTAKTLDLWFAVLRGSGMFVCEVLAAVLKLARERAARSRTPG